MFGQPAIYMKTNVAGRVEFERNLAVAQHCQQCRILDGTYAVTDAIGVQAGDGVGDAGGAHGLAGMRHAEQPGRLGGGKGVGKRRRGCADFVPPEAKADDAVCLPLQGIGKGAFGRIGIVTDQGL